MAKQIETKRIPTIATDVKGSVITLTFSDGSVVSVDADKLSYDIRTQALMHGLKQKLVDGAAMSKNEDGSPATVEDKFEAVAGIAERLLAGQWNKTRESGEGATGGLLFRALCEYKPEASREQIKAFLAGKSKEEQAALRAVPGIAAIIDRIRAKQAAASEIDASALLADLG